MVIEEKRIKEHNIGNVSWFGSIIFEELKNNGFDVRWDKGYIITDAEENDLSTILVDMNFMDGRKRTIKELCLKY